MGLLAQAIRKTSLNRVRLGEAMVNALPVLIGHFADSVEQQDGRYRRICHRIHIRIWGELARSWIWQRWFNSGSF
jgi:hypothetical protein